MKPIFNSLWAEKASFLWFIHAVFRQNNPTLSQSSPLLADRLTSSIHFIITALISFLSIRSIVVKMATGSGWQQYYCPAGQGKFSSSSASSGSVQSGITMEYTQDLHLKMSKKIAQLTKVKSIIIGPIPLSLSSVSTLGWDLVPRVVVWEPGAKLRLEFYPFSKFSQIVQRS